MKISDLILEMEKFKISMENKSVDNSRFYQKIDELCGTLKNNEYFKDEYYNFRDISDMIKDILNNTDSVKKSDLDFISLLLDDFIKFISHKNRLIENNEFSPLKFSSEYNTYLTRFNKSKAYYYENIFGQSIDDELFIEYSNILLG